MWLPSTNTSGSTIGTSPCSTHSAAQRARTCALAWIEVSLGSSLPTSMVITAQPACPSVAAPS